MNTKFVAVIVLPLALTLSACGDTWGERAVTGGGIGAGTGLAIGAVAGWPLLAPILVGTAVGAGIGAATAPTSKWERSAGQQPDLALEDGEHVFQRIAVRELARAVVDHVAALASPGTLAMANNGCSAVWRKIEKIAMPGRKSMA